MGKQHYIVLSCAVLLFALLYFFGRTTPPPSSGTKVSPASQGTLTTLNIADYLQTAKLELDSAGLATLNQLEGKLGKSKTTSEEREALLELSKTWNEKRRFLAGGYYAERLAELTPPSDTAEAEEAWSIAGTTYGIGFQREERPEWRAWGASKAIKAFEKASLLNPRNVAHKVNMAISYVEGTQEPMTGITMLREIVNEDPKNDVALMALGRFAIKTGQYARAIERLKAVTAIQGVEPTVLVEAYYLMGDAYKALNKRDSVVLVYNKAIVATDNPSIKAGLEKELNTYLTTPQ